MKPNGLRKNKEIEPTPKQDENAHPNTCNPSRVNTGGAPRLDTDKASPHNNHNANSPAKSTPTPRVDP